jgi:hypothetical protein
MVAILHVLGSDWPLSRGMGRLRKQPCPLPAAPRTPLPYRVCNTRSGPRFGRLDAISVRLNQAVGCDAAAESRWRCRRETSEISETLRPVGGGAERGCQGPSLLRRDSRRVGVRSSSPAADRTSAMGVNRAMTAPLPPVSRPPRLDTLPHLLPNLPLVPCTTSWGAGWSAGPSSVMSPTAPTS